MIEDTPGARMSLLAPPGPREAWRYLRHNGPRRALAKLLAGYVAGRQRWHVTLESLTRIADAPRRTDGLELRFARVEDLPRMERFAARVPRAVLRRWCEPAFMFFLALAGGEPVSYRCLSTRVHPGVAGFIRLGSGQVFMVDEYTDPAFRRRGITRRMTEAMAPWLIAGGVREVVGVHRVDNHETIAAARAKGIPRVGTVTRTRLLWKVWFEWCGADALDQARGASPRGESPIATTTSAPGAAMGWTPRPYAATSSTSQPAHGVPSSS
ncbi:MAG TPA: GNAT family N-acetyltransferase [Methylomirabilota bacterium]|nr:GNAT family N-acetyltransferase [Methylomirabilota bacterium]